MQMISGIKQKMHHNQTDFFTSGFLKHGRRIELKKMNTAIKIVTGSWENNRK